MATNLETIVILTTIKNGKYISPGNSFAEAFELVLQEPDNQFPSGMMRGPVRKYLREHQEKEDITHSIYDLYTQFLRLPPDIAQFLQPGDILSSDFFDFPNSKLAESFRDILFSLDVSFIVRFREWRRNKLAFTLEVCNAEEVEEVQKYFHRNGYHTM